MSRGDYCELPNWPDFKWDSSAVEGPLAAVARNQGHLQGRLESLGFRLRDEAVVQTLTHDVVKWSEIEGDILDRSQVRSSIARRLGIEATSSWPEAPRRPDAAGLLITTQCHGCAASFPGRRLQCTNVHMKRYSVAEVRRRLADALDLAESGEAVAIERRGVVFELTRRDAPRRVTRARKLIEILDESIAEGDWYWTAPGPKMTVKVPKTRRAGRRKK